MRVAPNLRAGSGPPPALLRSGSGGPPLLVDFWCMKRMSIPASISDRFSFELGSFLEPFLDVLRLLSYRFPLI